MSVKENNVETLEKEVVVNNETTELVEVKEDTKKTKVKAVAKKVLKVAGVATVGVLGYVLGAKSASKNDNYEYVEVDSVESSDVE